MTNKEFSRSFVLSSSYINLFLGIFSSHPVDQCQRNSCCLTGIAQLSA